MVARDARLEVGRIAKSHGLKGDVIVAPLTNRLERFIVGSVLWVGDVPREIQSSRPHQERYLVHFEGIDDRDAADRVRGSLLTAEPLDEPGENELWVHELIGAHVRDREGRDIGDVVAVEANPAHDLLVLDGGVLIPIVFVVEHDAGAVIVELPDGLLELFE